MADAQPLVRVLYRSLLRAAVRIERHWEPRQVAAVEIAGIAARAQRLPAAAQAARKLEATRPTLLVQHTFRGTIPPGVDLGALAEGLGDRPTTFALPPAFEALRAATALATDLELCAELTRLASGRWEESPASRIERGMWMISERHQHGASSAGDGTALTLAAQGDLDMLAEAARQEHERLTKQGGCADPNCGASSEKNDDFGLTIDEILLK